MAFVGRATHRYGCIEISKTNSVVSERLLRTTTRRSASVSSVARSRTRQPGGPCCSRAAQASAYHAAASRARVASHSAAAPQRTGTSWREAACKAPYKRPCSAPPDASSTQEVVQPSRHATREPSAAPAAQQHRRATQHGAGQGASAPRHSEAASRPPAPRCRGCSARRARAALSLRPPSGLEGRTGMTSVVSLRGGVWLTPRRRVRAALTCCAGQRCQTEAPPRAAGPPQKHPPLETAPALAPAQRRQRPRRQQPRPSGAPCLRCRSAAPASARSIPRRGPARSGHAAAPWSPRAQAPAQRRGRPTPAQAWCSGEVPRGVTWWRWARVTSARDRTALSPPSQPASAGPARVNTSASTPEWRRGRDTRLAGGGAIAVPGKCGRALHLRPERGPPLFGDVK